MEASQKTVKVGVVKQMEKSKREQEFGHCWTLLHSTEISLVFMREKQCTDLETLDGTLGILRENYLHLLIDMLMCTKTFLFFFFLKHII